MEMQHLLLAIAARSSMATRTKINKTQPQLDLFNRQAINYTISISRFLRTSLSIPSVSLCGS